MTPTTALPDFRHRDLVSIDQLNRPDADALLACARAIQEGADHDDAQSDVLRGRTVFNLFLEPSTRTRASFEIAAKRLGAQVINVASSGAATQKGESLLDSAITLDAMGADMIVLRAGASGAAAAARNVVAASIINAGDGAHGHPTQALVDALTLQSRFGAVEGLGVAIIGDIAHSRVARSNIQLLQLLGAQVRIAAPATLTPRDVADWGVEACATAADAAQGCDAIMALRVQRERIAGRPALPSVREYARFFGVSRDVLNCAKPHAILLHPGPLNRGVEIAADLADDPAISLITSQVGAGVAVRMAVMTLIAESLGSEQAQEARHGR